MSKIRVYTTTAQETRTLFEALTEKGFVWNDNGYSPMTSDLTIPRRTAITIEDGRKVIQNANTNIETKTYVSLAEGLAFIGVPTVASVTVTTVTSDDFTKADLQPGMVVVRRDGVQRLVANTTSGLVFIQDANEGNKYNTVDTKYNEDLTHVSNENRDIVAVYSVAEDADVAVTATTGGRSLVWDRNANAPKTMTKADIEAALGYSINIVD